MNNANTRQSQVWLVAVSYFCKMDRNKCIVPACNSLRKNEKVVPIHRLPRNSITGREWLELCGNEELRNVPYDGLTSKRFFICRLHFDDRVLTKTQSGAIRLKYNAIPTLNLPDKDGVSKKSNANVINIDLPDKDLHAHINVDQLKFSSPSVGKMTISESKTLSEGIRESSLHFLFVSIHFVTNIIIFKCI